MKLSIVIPTYNGRAHLERCLHSVQLHRPPESEVIVVDDGSQDGTTSWLRRCHPEVRWLGLPGNFGFCRAINAGIRLARGTIIETLNNDTVVTAGWTDTVLPLFDDDRVGCVAPQVRLLGQPDLLDSAGESYHLCGHAVARRHGQPPADDEILEVFGASASAAFYRREALLQAGLFPEDFGAYYDDVDLAFRLRWAGYRCLHQPHSCVYHRLHGTYDHGQRELIVQFSRNEERVFWVNLPGALLWRAVPLHLANLAIHGLAKTFLGNHGLAYLEGKWQALREWRAIRRQRAQRQLLSASARHAPSWPLDSRAMPLELLRRLRIKLAGRARNQDAPPARAATALIGNAE